MKLLGFVPKGAAFILFLTFLLLPKPAEAVGACTPQGWAPEGYGLKDHSVFTYNGMYYVVSIYLSNAHWEDRFAYARSSDLCSWEELDPVLVEREEGAWDEWRVWAPFVLEENGVYYMFYTGVTTEGTQSTMLATSTNPADPAAWQSHGMVFQPSHAGKVWEGWGHWSDARDPHVLKVNDQYYLYYTGVDIDGGIVGVATASNLLGPWQDWGATLTVPGARLESPGVVEYGGFYYIFYNRALDGGGPEMRVGPTPAGPWALAHPLRPGWAHEFWTDLEGNWMTSYLSDYTMSGYHVLVRPIRWNTVGMPPRLFIGEHLQHIWMPFTLNTN